MEERQVTVDGVTPRVAASVLPRRDAEPVRDDRARSRSSRVSSTASPSSRTSARPIAATERQLLLGEGGEGALTDLDSVSDPVAARRRDRRGAPHPLRAERRRLRDRARQRDARTIRTSRSGRAREPASPSSTPRRRHALLVGRSYVVPDDVKHLCVPVLAHRLLLRDAATLREAQAFLVHAGRGRRGTAPVSQRRTGGPAGSGRPSAGRASSSRCVADRALRHRPLAPARAGTSSSSARSSPCSSSPRSGPASRSSASASRAEAPAGRDGRTRRSPSTIELTRSRAAACGSASSPARAAWYRGRRAEPRPGHGRPAATRCLPEHRRRGAQREPARARRVAAPDPGRARPSRSRSRRRPLDRPVRAAQGADREAQAQPRASSTGHEITRGVREYVDGDPIRLVHWPATARTGAVMVRELEGPQRTAARRRRRPARADAARRATRTSRSRRRAPPGSPSPRSPTGRSWTSPPSRPTGPATGPVRSALEVGRRLARAVAGHPGARPGPAGVEVRHVRAGSLA